MSAAIERIYETEFPERLNEPSLRAYYPDLRDPYQAAKFMRYQEDMLRFADFEPAGKEVLEVGCGFGLGLIWFATQGAHASGVEIVPWMVDDVHTYLERLPTEIRDRVAIRQGSASRIPSRDSCFDLVLANEAISHYLEYEPFLVEVSRVLRPGGVLLIVDGNNGLNPFIRRHSRRIWALHERDIGDQSGPWLFVAKRQRIIQENFPTLDSSDAHMLALRTAGMVRAQIVDAVHVYLQSGKPPDSIYRLGQLSVHPEHEMVMERLFNPYSLAREIRSHGFHVKVAGYWGGASGSRLLRTMNRVLAALSPLTIFSARSFRIAAAKVEPQPPPPGR